MKVYWERKGLLDFKGGNISYRPRTREYWLAVTDGKCAYDFYDDEIGWRHCGREAREVHHIIGEAETLFAGIDPEHNVGLPLCSSHHSKNRTREAEWERDFSFHPDIGDAYSLYRDWVQGEKHLNAIGGQMSVNYRESPFADAARNHRVMAERGERYIAGSPEIDQYYIDKMRDKAVRYNAENYTTKPQMKAHPEYDPSKKKSEWDFFYET